MYLLIKQSLMQHEIFIILRGFRGLPLTSRLCVITKAMLAKTIPANLIMLNLCFEIDLLIRTNSKKQLTFHNLLFLIA